MPIICKTPEGVVYTRARSAYLWVRFKGPDGPEIRKSAGTKDVDRAVAFLKETYARSRALSFEEAVVDFFDVKSGHLKRGTIGRYKQNLRSIDRHFGGLTLMEIDNDRLKTFVNTRRREVSDTTVRRELAFLSTVFTHAVDLMPNGPSKNPVLTFNKKSLKEVVRDRWLTPDEMDRLLASCWTEMHRAILTVAVNTGMRHSELLNLRKPMVDLDNRKVILPGARTKNAKPRVIPLNEEAARTLEEVCENAPEDLVFWHKGPTGEAKGFTSFNNFWRKTRERAKLEDVRFHDLRHTFASWWVQRGGGLYALKDILGHGSLDMVQRYAYLDTAASQREMDVVFPHTSRTLSEKRR